KSVLQTDNLNKCSSVKQIEFVRADEISDTRALLTYHGDATFSEGDDNNTDQYFKQYIAVPVAFENNTYGIYGNPQFKNVSYQTDVQGNIPENLTSYQGDNQEVTQFLETFFVAYADNEQDTLGYLTTKESNIKPLDSNMSFTKLSNVEVKQNEKGNTIALVDVTFTENSGISFTSSFSVEIGRASCRERV